MQLHLLIAACLCSPVLKKHFDTMNDSREVLGLLAEQPLGEGSKSCMRLVTWDGAEALYFPDLRTLCFSTKLLLLIAAPKYLLPTDLLCSAVP